MSIKKNVVAAACGLALAASAFAPGLAFAANVNGTYTDEYQGTTEVKIKLAEDGNNNPQLSFSIPTEIIFAAHGNGDLTASEFAIKNKSIFPIKVAKIAVAAAKDTPWNLTSSAEIASTATSNALWFELNNVDASLCKDGGMTVTGWSMDSMGTVSSSNPETTTDQIKFTPKGKIANVKQNLASSTDAATITWTLAYGK